MYATFDILSRPIYTRKKTSTRSNNKKKEERISGDAGTGCSSLSRHSELDRAFIGLDLENEAMNERTDRSYRERETERDGRACHRDTHSFCRGKKERAAALLSGTRRPSQKAWMVAESSSSSPALI